MIEQPQQTADHLRIEDDSGRITLMKWHGGDLAAMMKAYREMLIERGLDCFPASAVVIKRGINRDRWSAKQPDAVKNQQLALIAKRKSSRRKY